MQPQVFDETLIVLKQRMPFRPFTIALVNGDQVEVDRPDVIACRDGIGMFVRPGGIPAIFDYEEVSEIIAS